MNLWQSFVNKFSSFSNNFSVAPTYIKAGAIVFLIFLLVISLAQFRHHFVKWCLNWAMVITNRNIKNAIAPAFM